MSSTIYPQSLQRGDLVRVIAPSRSLGLVDGAVVNYARNTLEAMGLRVSFGAHALECDKFDSSPIQARLDDLHDAFRDDQVKAVFSAIGGYNSNQLLRGIDFELIRSHPKIFCGYSDVTILTHAIHAKAGLVTYSGPHFSTFGMQKGAEYIQSSFERCCFSKDPYSIEPSSVWSDDLWHLDQVQRTFHPNSGYWIIHPPSSSVTGITLGGHIATFTSLHGTGYLPNLTGALLFLETTGDLNPQHFDRLLQSIILQPAFGGVQGLLIGRFQPASKMTLPLLHAIIQNASALSDLPVIANLDFGHTEPLFTFPIGGKVTLAGDHEKVVITVLEH